MMPAVEQKIFSAMPKKEMNRNTAAVRFNPRVLRRFDFILDFRVPRGG